MGLGHYISRTAGGWCCLLEASENSQQNKAKFQVNFAEIVSKDLKQTSLYDKGIRLKNVSSGTSFGVSNYLYASTSGFREVRHMKYDANTKQIWVPQRASDQAILQRGQFEYDEPVMLRDAFCGSVLCKCKHADCKWDANKQILTSQYEFAYTYFDKEDTDGKQCMTWVFEKCVS